MQSASSGAVGIFGRKPGVDCATELDQYNQISHCVGNELKTIKINLNKNNLVKIWNKSVKFPVKTALYRVKFRLITSIAGSFFGGVEHFRKRNA